MLEVTEKQMNEIIAAEMTMQSCMESYQEAVEAFNQNLMAAFEEVDDAATEYGRACEKAEECRKSVAKSLRRNLKKLPKELLVTPEGVQAVRWVEAWENMELDPADAPEPPEEMNEPDFPEFQDKFAKIPFLANQYS